MALHCYCWTSYPPNLFPLKNIINSEISLAKRSKNRKLQTVAVRNGKNKQKPAFIMLIIKILFKLKSKYPHEK